MAQDGTVLPAPLDLIQSKWDTSRDKDQQDILFLESLVRTDYKKRLPTADLEEATAMLERYTEWQVLQAALEKPSEEVQALAHQHLREFAEAGDPFSQAILEGREIPQGVSHSSWEPPRRLCGQNAHHALPIDLRSSSRYPLPADP